MKRGGGELGWCACVCVVIWWRLGRGGVEGGGAWGGGALGGEED